MLVLGSGSPGGTVQREPSQCMAKTCWPTKPPGTWISEAPAAQRSLLATPSSAQSGDVMRPGAGPGLGLGMIDQRSPSQCIAAVDRSRSGPMGMVEWPTAQTSSCAKTLMARSRLWFAPAGRVVESSDQVTHGVCCCPDEPAGTPQSWNVRSAWSGVVDQGLA